MESAHQRPEDDLAYIRQVMANTRRGLVMGGGYFVLWGVIGTVGLALTWAYLARWVAFSPMWSWAVLLIVGWSLTALMVRREKREPVQSRGGRLVGEVWAALGVTQLILYFIGVPAQAIDSSQLPGLFTATIGAGVFLTGALTGMVWLRLVAMGWWLGAVVMLLWQSVHVIGLMAAMMVLLYLVPGMVLMRMKRRILRGAV